MALDPDTFDALLSAVRRFVAERLRPLEAQVEADDAVPEAIVAEMRAPGLFGPGCRSWAARPISPIAASSGCTATCGCSASTKAPARSSN